MESEMFLLPVEGQPPVSALLLLPTGASAAYVCAHGAGAGMRHASMERVARGLAERGIAVLRFNFGYMERGGRRPDPPPLAHAAVRAAVAEAGARLPGLPLFAGGRSFGGRMTSQAQAAAPLPGIAGLVFVGFPLHPAGKPGTERAAHLAKVHVPMLFLSGTRDELADLALLRPVVESLGEPATLVTFDGADHMFQVPAKSGRTDAQVLAAALDAAAGWMQRWR